ncbi:MAG TPA: Minf_1886 family protein [Opitutaceae bacterium]
MQNPDFGEIVALICKEDPRFERKAYDFVRLGLDHTVKELRKKDADRAEKSRHVSGPELLEGLRVYALDQFGPMAKTVLNAWGVKRCSDFGDIVFNLIEYNVFSKTENDRREDFADIFDFEEAFVKPFQPMRRPRGTRATGAAGALDAA